jgi:hypothetical protein
MRLIEPSLMKRNYNYVFRISFLKSLLENVLFIEIDFFFVSKLSIDLFFKLPVSRFLAINIEGKIGQLTVRKT